MFIVLHLAGNDGSAIRVNTDKIITYYKKGDGTALELIEYADSLEVLETEKKIDGMLTREGLMCCIGGLY